MSFAVTDQNIYNIIQQHLLETPNNGASYGSSLYTAAEVSKLLNNRLQEFYKQTSIISAIDTNILTTPDERDQEFPDDLMDIIRLGIAED